MSGCLSVRESLRGDREGALDNIGGAYLGTAEVKQSCVGGQDNNGSAPAGALAVSAPELHLFRWQRAEIHRSGPGVDLARTPEVMIKRRTD